jgi:Ribbon-helix-helix protein, copG family
MLDNMIRTQISVDADTYKKAKQVARRRGISLAELCRRALEETLAREPVSKPWMEYAGMFDGNPEDSATVDWVVYDREKP